MLGNTNIGDATVSDDAVSDDGRTLSFSCTYGEIKDQIRVDSNTQIGYFTLTYTLTIPEKYADNTTVGNFRKAFGQYLLSSWDSDGDGTYDTPTTKFIVMAGVTIS